MKVVVIGGTGLIGSKLVAILRGHDHEVVAASPHTGVDTITGEGLAHSLAGASVVVDVANTTTSDPAAVLEFFETSTRNVLAAASAAGVAHHIALSAVGTERLQGSGYHRAKRAQERLIEASSIPWTIVHSTQCFELVRSIADAAEVDGAVRLAPVLIQPIAADDVASVLAAVVAGVPARGVVEIAGPQEFRLDEFVRSGLAAAGDPRPVVADPRARYLDAELRERTLVPGDPAVLAQTRFGDWVRSPQAAEHRHREQIVGELVVEHAQVSGGPIRIDERHWAIHGLIAVDGDVMLAKFDDPTEAQTVIELLWEVEGG
jgi:uncharacterized protein YbjT (DUF2867 family)